MTEPPGIRGGMAGLYDDFVDWPGRLGREMPGLLTRFREHGLADGGRILDAGCGTGRHLTALLEAGYDTHGADISENMLEQARAHVADEARIHEWRIGTPPPAELAGSFDATCCLGNTLSLLEDPALGLAGLRATLRPGGLFVAGLKAVAIRRERDEPYMPLLRREHEGGVLHFIRFVEFDEKDADAAYLHLVVVRNPDEALFHRSRRIHVWSPATLRQACREAGFEDVRISARLADPDAEPESEDVFVHARAPA